MSIEIRKAVRQIIAPMAVFVPCMALMAATPAFAKAQSADSNSSQSSSEAPTQLRRVVIVAAEKAVATVEASKFVHLSPSSNVVSVLNNVAGFNARTLGPGGLLAGGNPFTLDGFSSTQVGTTFDGAPIIDTFLGGIYGAGDTQAVTPLDMGQVSGVQVYSGSSTQAKSSIDSLGGTINYAPALPTKQFNVQVSGSGGEWSGGGSLAREGFAINSGAISSLNGLNVLAKFSHSLFHGFQDNVSGHVNSYYLAAVQPTHAGEIKLIAAVNTENAMVPSMIPLGLLQKFGYRYNWPVNVGFTNSASHATHVVLSMKSLLNPMTIGEIKVFYSGTTNNRVGYTNATIAPTSSYLGYKQDLPATLKSCGALNGYLAFSPAPSTGQPYPNVYDCQLATQMFGGPAQGTQYQHYVFNVANFGTMGHLTLLLPHNTVQVGSMVMLAQGLSQESWFGKWPVPMQDGYNMAWLEHQQQLEYDAYAQDNISLLHSKLHIYPGVTWEQIHMNDSDSQGYYYSTSGAVSERWSFLEYSLGLNYAFTPELNVYVNYGKSYKAPNVSALYSVIGVNPLNAQIPLPVTVQPEYVNNVDAGIRFENKYVKASAAFYNRQFNNIFSENYSPVTGITTEYNAGTAVYRGFTLSGEVALPHNFAVYANYGSTSAKYTTNFVGLNGNISSGQWRPNIPNFTANLGLAYDHGPWYANVGAHGVGSQYMAYNSGLTSNQQLPSYVTVDAMGSYVWAVNDDTLKSLKFTVHLDNLLNKHAIVYGNVFSHSDPYAYGASNGPMFVGLSVTASLF